MTKVAEDNFAIHWGLATRYATAFCPPIRYSVSAHKAKERGEKLTLGVSWNSGCRRLRLS